MSSPHSRLSADPHKMYDARRAMEETCSLQSRGFEASLHDQVVRRSLNGLCLRFLPGGGDTHDKAFQQSVADHQRIYGSIQVSLKTRALGSRNSRKVNDLFFQCRRISSLFPAQEPDSPAAGNVDTERPPSRIPHLDVHHSADVSIATHPFCRTGMSHSRPHEDLGY